MVAEVGKLSDHLVATDWTLADPFGDNNNGSRLLETYH